MRLWSVKSGHAVQRMTLGRLDKHKETIVWCVAILRYMIYQAYTRKCTWKPMYQNLRERFHTLDFFGVILCNCVLSVIETVQMIRLIMCKWYVVNFSGAELTITCLFFPTQWYDPGQWWLERKNNFLERKTRDTNQGLNVWKNSINSREIQYQYIYMQYLMIAKGLSLMQYSGLLFILLSICQNRYHSRLYYMNIGLTFETLYRQFNLKSASFIVYEYSFLVAYQLNFFIHHVGAYDSICEKTVLQKIWKYTEICTWYIISRYS